MPSIGPIPRALARFLALGLLAGPVAAQGDSVGVAADSVVLRLVNTEFRAAVQVLGQYIDRPVLFAGQGTALVTLETPRPVHRNDVIRLLRGLVESQNHEFLLDTAAAMYRVRPREPVRPASPQGQAPIRAVGQPTELHVIALQHARAADVASTVNALYGRGGGALDSPARVSTLADELRSNLVPPSGAATAPALAQRSGSLSGELTIVADPRANALLVRANALDLALVREVVQALDVRPLQVLIEVLVAEVRRDRSLGINTETTLDPTTVGKVGTTIEGVLGSSGLGDFALKVMDIGGMQIDATLRLAASRGNVRILTRPVLLATNNQLAEIVVGSQRPFVQVQRSLPTDGASRDQIVQYKDVGTKLTVRPTISADGSVQMEVTQEVSTATAELAFDAPVISTRSVSTQLLVRDGQTVALGGLTDRVRESTRGGIPLLSAVPLIGGLFGSIKEQTFETELFVFLTPRVIRSDEDASRLTTPLKSRIDGGKEKEP